MMLLNEREREQERLRQRLENEEPVEIEVPPAFLPAGRGWPEPPAAVRSEFDWMTEQGELIAIRSGD